MPGTGRGVLYKYTVTYADGKKRRCGPDFDSHFDATDDQYRRIIQGVAEGHDLMDIKSIDDVREKMEADVRRYDSHWNMNGSFRETPLKKAREIVGVRLYLNPLEVKRIRALKNPMEEINRPEQTMRVYRNDGSYIDISYKYGEIQYVDSREEETTHALSADWFISRVTGR